MPRSLFGRLLSLSALTTVLALAFAAWSIGHVLERFVIHGLDQQLDTEARMLARAVRPDGTLDRARVVDLPGFADAEEGWGWRIDGPAGRWVGGARLASAPMPAPPGPPDMHERERRDIWPAEAVAASGERLHLRQFTLATPAGDVTITASSPRRIALEPLREAMVPLFGSLALLGLALATATVVQLHFGLRPLRTLRTALAEVRSGRARHIPPGQPHELAPLATELNALLDRNAAQLEQARRHVANLAHGLKTPLAALGVRLAESGRDPDGSLAAMVAEVDSRVRHHLGRARAQAPGGGPRSRTVLAPAVDDLLAALGAIHADRPVAATAAIGPTLTVAADPQDLDEMLGNLLDNAWRHARTAVSITAEERAGTIKVAIEDDGSGLSDGQMPEALVPGRRLDERGDGHGFGLPIALELAELSGGRLALDRSKLLGGLRAVLALPGGAID